MNRRLLVAVCLVAAVLGGVLVWVLKDDDPATRDTAPRPHPTGVVKTDLPGLTPATGEPSLQGIQSAAPDARKVTLLPGPFDDRFKLTGLRFDGTAVTGTMTITSDVSDVLELQVLAGFYDAGGTFLGDARFTHHLDEDTHADAGPPSEQESFRIAVPAKFRGQAASAAVGVPVLVNE
ncbi:MAG: hypothetical protein J7518_11920 [Nocardioidaceae bacterium]|nr:hypothetical protein [Nocardioidaceae bacterium]